MKLNEIMTARPAVLPGEASILDAARPMRDNNIGDVLVTRQEGLCGIVTDRDIVVRVVAEGMDPAATKLDAICSHQVTSLSPESTSEEAVRMMREKAVRRIPVVEQGRPVGIVSIGDLATRLEPKSALAKLSAAAANR